MRRVVHAQALHTRPSPRLSTGLLSVAVGGGVVGGGGSRFVARAITCASSASTVICARNTRVRGRHGAAGSQLRRESYSQNLQVGGAPLHDRSVPRFAAPVDVAAPVRSARPGVGGTVHRLRLDAEGVVPRTGSCRGDLNVVILLDDSFPLVAPPLDVAASVRSARPEADGMVQRFHSLSLAALSRPASPARAPASAPATAAPQRWSGTVVVRLQTSRACVHGDLRTLGQARGVCVAGCRLGGSRRKDEEAQRDGFDPNAGFGLPTTHTAKV